MLKYCDPLDNADYSRVTSEMPTQPRREHSDIKEIGVDSINQPEYFSHE